MAVTINTYYSKKLIEGAKPSTPSFPVGETPPILNPPGSGTTIAVGTGITLNGIVIGGVMRVIQESNTLDIPEFWQYNIHGLSLDVLGIIQNNGEINVG